MTTSSPRRGFTLVELLAVVTIIGLLVALLIPAVQAAREASRRTTCSNNIRQIGAALQSHSSLIGTLPAANVGSPSSGAWPWMIAILPYLEQKSTHDLLRAAHPYNYTNANGLRAIAEAPIPAFICPSCSVGVLETALADIRGPDGGWLDGLRSSKSNYLGNGGPQGMYYGEGSQCTPASTPEENRRVTDGIITQSRGAIRKSVGLPASQITDGLSNTFLVGESGAAGRNQRWLVGAWAAAYRWDDPMMGALRYGSAKINAGRSDGFNSMHPDGANFVMCDGSVRFVSDYISHNPGNLIYAYTYCSPVANPNAATAAVDAMRRAGYGVFQYLSIRDDRQAISREDF